MPELDNISHANTRPMEPNGAVHVHQVKITRTKRYDVMIAYGGHGGAEMLKAANFKRKRLKEQYPHGEIPETKVFRTRQEFKDIWTNIFIDLGLRNKSGMPTYDLHEIHIFAHSNSDHIKIKEGENIDTDIIKQLEQLKWNDEKGYLVLHSCRSARWEDDDVTKRESEDCLASDFSKYHKAYVIGQMVYASFNYGEKPEDWLYRDRFNDKIAVDFMGLDELVLWGYKSGTSINDHYSKNKEYTNLTDGQIWPCRKYRNGAEHKRSIAIDMFNYDDLTFI
jgi:hypothetical protein